MKNEKDMIKDLFCKGKKFFKELDEVITEEVAGNDMVDYLRNKAKAVQVKVEEKIDHFTTEEIIAEDQGNKLVITLVLPDLEKSDIGIDIEDSKLLFTINDKKTTKQIKKHWSVSKTKLFYDYSRFEDSVKISDITSKLEKGILTVTIPKTEKEKTKTKINVQ